MSDSNSSGETPDSSSTPPPPPQNPYGQPPAQSDPYGQPPAAADPYGQPPAAAPAYGQQPAAPAYGQQAYPPQQGYGAPGHGVDPHKRPGTVTAAGVVTIIFSGITLLVSALGLIGLLVARDDVLDEVRSNPDFDTAGIDADSAYGLLVGVAGVLTLWCLIALVLGILVLRRSNGARIALVISSAVSAVLSLLAIGSLLSGLWLIASIAVIVLLFTGGAGDWFKNKNAATV